MATIWQWNVQWKYGNVALRDDKSVVKRITGYYLIHHYNQRSLIHMCISGICWRDESQAGRGDILSDEPHVINITFSFATRVTLFSLRHACKLIVYMSDRMSHMLGCKKSTSRRSYISQSFRFVQPAVSWRAPLPLWRSSGCPCRRWDFWVTPIRLAPTTSCPSLYRITLSVTPVSIYCEWIYGVV